MKPFLSLAALAALLAVLAGCGGGGGGGLPSSRPAGGVAGVAHDAPLTNAPLRVFAWDGGQRGELLGETTTDTGGDYSLAITSRDRPVLIEAGRGGSYIEEASGRRVSLGSNQALQAVVRYRSGAEVSVQVTPLTTIAACYADFLVRQGTSVDDAVDQANSKLSALFGVEVTEDRPVDVTDPANASITLTDGLRYGLWTAAISQTMAEVSGQNAIAPHALPFATSINWATVACNDVIEDGRLDGVGRIAEVGSSGALSFGSHPITPDSYRRLVAQRLLTFVASQRNATGLGVNSEVMTLANALSSSNDGFWAGEPGQPVDNEGPLIAQQVPDGAALAGEATLAFLVSDPVGVEAIRYFLDNALIRTGGPEATELVLDTTGFADGAHSLRVEAEDALGNIRSLDLTYRFVNIGPALNITSDELVAETAYDLTGTWESPAVAMGGLDVQVGESGPTVAAAVNDDGTWRARLSLASGLNALTITARDVLGNATVMETSVGVDLIPPVVEHRPTQGRFTVFNGQWNSCDIADITPASVRTRPLCLRTDRLSLEGALAGPNLENLNYLVLQVAAGDATGTGVGTPVEDLVAEYRYELDGEELVSWTPLTTRGPGLDIESFYLPLTTEFFPAAFHQVGTDQQHVAEIRVTDAAGNASTVTWRFSLDVLAPVVEASTTNNLDALFAGGWAGRTALDGAEVIQETVLENTTGTTLYIDPRPSKAHRITHHYEEMQRANRVRWRSERRIVIDGTLRSGVTIYVDGAATGPHNSGTVAFGGWETPESDTIPLPADQHWDRANLADAQFISRDRLYRNYGYAGGWGYEHTPALGSGVFGELVPALTVDRVTEDSLVHSLNYDSDEICTPYPCNVVTVKTVTHQVASESLDVLADGTPAALTEGWYTIAPGATALVRRRLRLPAILHFTDPAVATRGTTDYALRRLDLDTVWELDLGTPIEMVADPGGSARTLGVGGLVTRTLAR